MTKKLVLVPLAVCLHLALLYLVLLLAPAAGADQLRFPGSLEELRAVAALLSRYSQHNPGYVVLLFSLAYLFKQTFAVPGSVFLNVLAGAIFGAGAGFLLCCLLTATGRHVSDG